MYTLWHRRWDDRLDDTNPYIFALYEQDLFVNVLRKRQNINFVASWCIYCVNETCCKDFFLISDILNNCTHLIKIFLWCIKQKKQILVKLSPWPNLVCWYKFSSFIIWDRRNLKWQRIKSWDYGIHHEFCSVLSLLLQCEINQKPWTYTRAMKLFRCVM